MDYGHCDSLKWTRLEGNWMYKYGIKKNYYKFIANWVSKNGNFIKWIAC